MQKFLNENRLRYDVTEDVEMLGRLRCRLSDSATVEEQLHVKMTGELPKKSVGRPLQFTYNCRFCDAKAGPEGQLRKHWQQTHNAAQRFHTRLPKAGDYLNCKVDTCGYRCKDAKTYRKHLANEKAHSVPELLANGIEAWIYRAQTPKTVRETLAWLKHRGFVVQRAGARGAVLGKRLRREVDSEYALPASAVDDGDE